MKIKSILIVACIGMMFAACSSRDDYSTEGEKIPIRINATIDGHLVGTRAVENSANLHGTSFVNGEEFYVNIYYSDTKQPISPCTEYSGIFDCEYRDGEIILQDAYYPLDMMAFFDVISFFPDNVDGTSYVAGDGAFYVQKDQSNDANYRISDFMFAINERSLPVETIDLTFHHLMSKVIVKLNGYEGTASKYSVSIKQVQTQTELDNAGTKNVAIGETSEEYKEIADIKMGNYADAGVTAIVIPQEISSGKDLFEVTIGTSTYVYKTTSNITFESGYVYTFNLNFNTTNITTGSITIEDWKGKQSQSNVFNGDLEQ